MGEMVTVEFNPPRKCRSVKESWLLTADGEPDLFLPRSKTTRSTPDGNLVFSVTVPFYVANDPDRDWGSVTLDLPQEDDTSSSMTRHDWFRLGATMALIISGASLRDAAWEAGKVVDKLEEMR